MFRPQKASQLTTPIQIQIAVSGGSLGQKRKTYSNVSYISFCNWSSYGGTEREIDGVVSIEETATVTSWFDPNIKTDGRIIRLSDNTPFEILNVENVEMRNQFMIIKVRKIMGKA